MNPTRIIMPGDRAGTPGASYDRTRREQEFQGNREARLDRQRLRTNHLTPGKRWIPLLVKYMFSICLSCRYFTDCVVANRRFECYKTLEICLGRTKCLSVCQHRDYLLNKSFASGNIVKTFTKPNTLLQRQNSDVC